MPPLLDLGTLLELSAPPQLLPSELAESPMAVLELPELPTPLETSLLPVEPAPMAELAPVLLLELATPLLALVVDPLLLPELAVEPVEPKAELEVGSEAEPPSPAPGGSKQPATSAADRISSAGGVRARRAPRPEVASAPSCSRGILDRMLVSPSSFA